MEDTTADRIRELEIMIRLIDIETMYTRKRPCLITVFYHTRFVLEHNLFVGRPYVHGLAHWWSGHYVRIYGLNSISRSFTIAYTMIRHVCRSF